MISLQVAEARPQQELRAVLFHQWDFEDGTPWTRFYRTDTGYLLRFPELADFAISRDGTAVRCWPAPEVSEETIRHLYQNQVWPLALSRQGRLAFHACAVEIDGEGIAFLGASGKGKSTLAASFATAGFPFLTDDGLVLAIEDGSTLITPSFPFIRLWQDSQDAIMGSHPPAAPDVQYTTKARFLAGTAIVHCEEPRRLRRMYFLGEGVADQPEFHLLKPGDALIELVKHSFLLDIEEKELLAAHFNELARMVNEPIYYRLDYPRCYNDLARVRQAILEHVRQTKDHP